MIFGNPGLVISKMEVSIFIDCPIWFPAHLALLLSDFEVLNVATDFVFKNLSPIP